MAAADPTRQSWEQFQETGRCDETQIAPPILRSWQRCRALGVPPHRKARAAHRPALLLDSVQASLVAMARPFMEDMYQFVEGSGFAVLLADASLTLLEVIGDAEVLAEIEALEIGPGTSWREEQIGTIALNLALSEALPWQTCGAEHFCACYHAFACSSAPLFNVDGQAMGVVGVFGPRDAAHPHTLGMVIAAAHALHSQMRNNVLLAETNDHLAELHAAIEAISEGLLFVDASGKLGKLNSRAGQLLGFSVRSAAGRPLDELIEVPDTLRHALARRRELVDHELVFTTRKGMVATLCSVRPVWDRGRRYLGTLITLRPPESVQRLVQRVVGAQARFTFADIIGESPALQAAVRQARIAANAHAPVLLHGEAGVGKEMFAHAIHTGGRRAKGPFVALNCAAIPRALILGELLGYESRQTLDADSALLAEGRPGRLELAQSGTLLLEEIGALPVEAQTSLLRAIETQHLLRIGGQRVVPLDVRIIATTSTDLEQAVAEGRLRSDLFYRFSVLTIGVPPLRKRGDDVLLLLTHTLTSINRRMGKHTLLAPDALAALVAYPWPGNVRELEATLERLLHVTEKSVLTLADVAQVLLHVPPPSSAPSTSERLYDRHVAAEREAILRAGREAAGHLGRTAARLGISRATLWRKMKLYHVTKEQFWT